MLEPRSAHRLKILDFGLATLSREQVPEKSELQSVTEVLTGKGQAMGTVPNRSPEQLTGEPVDPRSDIFSLGIVLYEMAVGAELDFVRDDPRFVDLRRRIGCRTPVHLVSDSRGGRFSTYRGRLAGGSAGTALKSPYYLRTENLRPDQVASTAQIL